MKKRREYFSRSPEGGFSSNRRVKERSPEIMRDVVDRTEMRDDGHPLIMRDGETRGRVKLDPFDESRGERYPVIRDDLFGDGMRINAFDGSRWVTRDGVMNGARGERHPGITDMRRDGVMNGADMRRDGFGGTREGRDGFGDMWQEREPETLRVERQVRMERSPPPMADRQVRERSPDVSFNGGYVRNSFNDPKSRLGPSGDHVRSSFNDPKSRLGPNGDHVRNSFNDPKSRLGPNGGYIRSSFSDLKSKLDHQGDHVRSSFSDPKSGLDPYPLDGDCGYPDPRSQVSTSLHFPTEMGRNGERGIKRNLSQERGRSPPSEYRRTSDYVELPLISGGRLPENLPLSSNGPQIIDRDLQRGDQARRFSQTRIRSPSPKRRRVPGLVDGHEMGEIFSLDFGGPGKIHSYLTEKTGLISCPNGDLALFHIDQIWFKHPTIGYCKFLEIFSIDEVKRRFAVNFDIKFNARDARCQRTDINYQATAVWSAGNTLAPSEYRSPQASLELDRKLVEFCNPNMENRHPGAGSEELLEAKVHEYFSHEMGLLKLVKGDLGVVLFHLNQVWVEKSNSDQCDWVPLRNVQDQVMEVVDLPLGTKVMVKTRPIPAHQYSQLLYQAVAVWKVPERKFPRRGFGPVAPIIYATPDKHKVDEGVIYAELDRYHDVMKKLCKFERAVSASDFNPVPAVVNGLPAHWEAIVVAGLNHEFGVIRITNKDKADLSRVEDGFHVPGVKQLYAVFHLEDVFDVEGVSSYNNHDLKMQSLVNCAVDLTARSICGEETPKKILELQRGLMEDHQAVPVLQAVVVCVKSHPNIAARTANIPKPTCLRLEPGSFDPKYSTFYVNLLLRTRLDIKVHNFLRIPNKLNLPYDKIIKSTLPKDHKVKEKLDNLKLVDINRTSEKHYGRFNPKYNQLDPCSLPMSLHNVAAKIRLLHRNGIKSTCGLLEVQISDGKSYGKTYIFFDHSDYKFFSGYDCHASDLVNVMPVWTLDKFCVNAVLVNSRSKVPYMATCVWNENVRKELGAPVPQEVIAANAIAMKSHIIEKEIITEWTDIYYDREPVVESVRMNSKINTSENVIRSSNERSTFAPIASRSDQDHSRKSSTFTVESANLIPITSKRCPDNFGTPSTFSFKSDDKDYLLEQKRKMSASTSSRSHSRGKEDFRKDSSKSASRKLTHVKDSSKFTRNKDNHKTDSRKRSKSPNKDSQWFHFRVPPTAGTTQSGDFPLDERNVCIKDSKLVEYFGNCDGVIEKVLSQHYAVINYQTGKKSIRILLTSNDLFMETDNFENVINAKEKKLTMPLDKQLFPGDKVKFNAVMLASPEPNPSGINYYCTAAIYGYDCYKHFVPVLPFLSCKLTANDDWKNQFASIVACLSGDLVPEEKQKWLLSVPPLQAHKIEQFREFPPTLQGKKIDSWKTKRILGPPSEYSRIIEKVLKLNKHVDHRKSYEKPSKSTSKKAESPKSTSKKAESPKSTSKKAESPKSTSKKVESAKSVPKQVETPKTATKNDEVSDGDGILYTNGKVVEFLTNAEGTVEKLLGQHYGIIKYMGKGENGKYTTVRVLFTSRNMVLNNNANKHCRFGTGCKTEGCKFDHPKINKPCKFGPGCKNKKCQFDHTSLHCSTGDKLTFNAVLLRPKTNQNEAKINYYCTGAVKLVGNLTTQKSIPWMPIKTSEKTNIFYVKRFTEIMQGLSANLKMSPLLQKNLKSWGNIPESHKKSAWQTCPAKLRGLKVLGGKGLMTEFENSDDKVAEQEKVPVKIEPVNEENCPVYLNRKGRVIKIINENYGVLAGTVSQEKEKRVYQVIFDVHDVWIGDKTLKDIGKTLKDVMCVGDYVKFNGVHLKDMEKEKNRWIQDLATSLVISKNTLFKTAQFPSNMVPIKEMNQIQEEKLANFKVVAKAVGGMEVQPAEKKILESLEKGDL